jgi:hypothetical protein
MHSWVFILLALGGLWLSTRGIVATCNNQWAHDCPFGIPVRIPGFYDIAIGGTLLLMGLKLIPLPW